MPLYEYKCDGCGDVFELIQRFSDEPLTTHDKCGGAVHRLISAPALQFKGTGWYVTDYAKSGSSGNVPSKSEKADNDAQKAETKADDAKKSSSSSDSAKSSDSGSKTETKTVSSTTSDKA